MDKTCQHGVLVCVYGYGVLIQGKSGVGKSALALDLLSRGHSLVADDVVELSVSQDKLIGRCVESPVSGCLEVRTLGLLDIAALFGESALMGEHSVDLLVNLLDLDQVDIDNSDRIFGMYCESNVMGIQLPLFTLVKLIYPSLSLMLEMAVKKLALQPSLGGPLE